MKRQIFFITIFLFLIFVQADAQSCTVLGQTPGTAFPVCGITAFQQQNVPICSSVNLYVPGCSSAAANYQNKNPYWYRFTCYQSGTLGFLINPNNNDDYDWQLYDITGLDPNAVYTNRNIIVAGNWAGTYGSTGASAAGVSFIQCASNPRDNLNSFAQMPNIIVGHNYILLISHFSNTQFGYTLSFGGGTASITDPLKPAELAARAPCDGTLTTIKMNKAIKCSSLSNNGSEFTLVPNISNVTAAIGVNCSQSFDMDSINLTLDTPLPPGNYFVKIKKGTDGNTLTDNCDQDVVVGDSISLTIYPLLPTPMDSLTKFGCAPDTLQLVFKKRMFCNSVAGDGSDFIVTGPDPVSVTSAAGLNCVDGLSDKIIVKLSHPLQLGGVYTINLVTGSDGNTLLNECSTASLAASISFNVIDTVNADFTYNIAYNCKIDTVHYFHDARNGVNKWTWNFDDQRQSALQNPTILYATFGLKKTQLTVSNGVCKDTSAFVPILLDNLLNAAFTAPDFVCPNDQATFIDNSIGKNLSWNWIFDNGNTSTLQFPPSQTYPFNLRSDRTVAPQLIITDAYGCSDAANKTILIPNSCFIDVPNAFTPNGDGINDYLYPLAAYKASGLLFRIYNRFGQLIFEGHDLSQKWDGKMKGQPAEAGTYVWVLHYVNIETGAVIDRKGTSILIR